MSIPKIYETLEAEVVDDYLELHNNGEEVRLSEGDDYISLASNEYMSKQDVRMQFERIQTVLESMVHEGLERLRGEIAEEHRAKAVKHATMTPAEHEAQRQSWVRGEMALGTDADEERYKQEHGY